MHTNTIRICERSEALLMLRDGTFKDFLQMWSDQFPQKGKLQRIKDLKEDFGIGLREAKDMIDRIDSTCPNQEVWFEVGDTLLFRKVNNYLRWYLKVEGTWVSKGEVTENLTEKDFFPKESTVFVICTDQRIRRTKDTETLASQLLHRHWFRTGCYYRFGDEIWTLDSDSLLLVNTGSDPDSIKTKLLTYAPWMVRDHIDQYKKEHRDKHGL